jgi:hypothetical protein
MTIGDLAQILSALATIALAFLTLKYVRATDAMVTEMRTARIDSATPYVVVYPEYVGNQMYVVAENAGSAPCKDLRVTSESTLPPWLAGFGASGKILSRGFLPAGAKARQAADFVTLGASKEEFAPFTVEVAWQSLGGHGHQMAVTLEPWQLIANRPETDADRVVEALNNLARGLRAGARLI